MTDMTQAPTPGPLSGDDVKLLVKGDLLRGPDKVVFAYDRPYAAYDYHDRNGVWIKDEKRRTFLFRDTDYGGLTFIGRPDADGWMPWSGGEKAPVDGAVELKFRDGEVRTDLRPVACDWLHSPSRTAPDDIIAFRLAPTAPVEASGSERSVPICHEIPLSNHMKVTLEYDPDGSHTAMLWNEANQPIADGTAPDLSLFHPQPSGFLATLTDEQRTAALAHTGGDTHPQPSGETQAVEDIMSKVSRRDLSILLSCEQTEDPVGRARETLKVILQHALIRPAPVASGGQHRSATDFPPDDVLACVPVAETAGEIGRNITFSPFDLDTGNAVVSPQEPDGPYWTLIAQGGEAEQNRIAAEIVRRLNAPVPAQDDDKLRIAVEALQPFADIAGRYLTGGLRADIDARAPALMALLDPRAFYAAHKALAALKSTTSPHRAEINAMDDNAAYASERIAALKSTAAQKGGG